MCPQRGVQQFLDAVFISFEQRSQLCDIHHGTAAHSHDEVRTRCLEGVDGGLCLLVGRFCGQLIEHDIFFAGLPDLRRDQIRQTGGFDALIGEHGHLCGVLDQVGQIVQAVLASEHRTRHSQCVLLQHCLVLLALVHSSMVRFSLFRIRRSWSLGPNPPDLESTYRFCPLQVKLERTTPGSISQMG